MRPQYIHFIRTMHVVLGSISIWTLYALVSCVSVSCLSMAKKVRWELVYDPLPNDESFDRFAAADHHATVNLIQQRDEQQQQRDEQQQWRHREEQQQWRYRNEQQQRQHHHQQQQQKRDEWQQLRYADTLSVAASEACNCTEVPLVYNLTENHYPKELMSVTCSGNLCKTAWYSVPVLLKSNTQQVENQDDLPDELQQNVNHWKFDSVNITVACYCSIK
ncbi:UPF0746 protein DDB_G0281095 [Acyrthosiphon pisum]|uniref:Prothoracicotropic hormone n=1 Tax=Acyrthosiphon pisum TaxID=7029 RepID=A0A8R2NVA1_ACYPI|nr:UPF0746 protein DDB_G0281095 [Acyrthosiphon pisum]|eukprot:XP_003243880.1 PREDICTED: UPF0746 protein DDB_G0281095 [Acyrthosiphon pisum]